jgi:SAM-dependent methyltransferase
MDPASVYHSPRLAAGYAGSRPPVHARIIAAVARRFEELGIDRACRALDLGCGVGLSAAALKPLASRVFGLEPALAMLRHGRSVAPGACLVAARSEQLPFRDASFDLLAAAGSLNYADRSRVLAEASRVLTEEGVLLIYDFSGGRRLAGDERLDWWFTTFERRFPYAPGYEMDVRSLDYGAAGLRLVRFEEFEAKVPLSLSEYVAYAMSETNVEQAIAAGVPEQEIADWCRASLQGIFTTEPRDVIFASYVAYVRPSLPSAA